MKEEHFFNEKKIITITEGIIQDRAETILDRELTEKEMTQFRNGRFWEFDDARFLIWDAIDSAIEELISEDKETI